MVQVNLDVVGMMCGQCEAHVKDAIRKEFPEAKNLKASHVKGTASMRLAQALPDDQINQKLKGALDPWGYSASVASVEPVEEKKKKGFFHF